MSIVWPKLLARTLPWETAIANLTAYVGLQPSPKALALFLRMANSSNEGVRRLAKLALARTKPLSQQAKEVILRHDAEDFLAARTTIVVFALEDPDILKAFLAYVESDDVQEQESATKALARPALDSLLRLERGPELDESVARNVKRAIEAINGK